MELSNFPLASDADCQWLKQELSGLPCHCPYIFDNCRLPDGCHPDQAGVLLRREVGRYSMELDRSVQYRGRNRAMKVLARGTPVFFQDFSEMVRFFRALPEKRLGTGPPAGAEEPVVAMEELTLPQSEAPQLLRASELEQELSRRVMGQDHAIAVMAQLSAMHVNKQNPQKPLSIFAYGPPGTGKSEAAKALAAALSTLGPHQYSVAWTDTNTFSEPHSVSRLLGSPAGYVGYDDKPFFDAVVQNPYTVFIFDEIEKAAPQVLKVLMAVLDEGRCAAVRELPDHSREYKFHKSIFIFTSNMLLHGSEERRQKIGFAVPKAEEIREHEDGIEVIYKAPAPERQKDSLTGRIYHDNEVARKSFIAQGNLAEIASRFQCFLEFHELDDGAKIRILVKQVLESAAEYGIKIHHIDTGIMQELINICSAEQSLTVRSFRPVIESCLAPAFSEASADPQGESVRLSGTLDEPQLLWA